MADKKKKRSNSDAARRIWLAGIGAYGRAFSEAQEALKDVTGGTSRVFDELVQKGEMIEKAVELKSKDLMDKANMPSFNMDERIQKMRSRLARGEEMADDLSDIEARLDRLDAKLDEVLAALKPAKPKAKPKRKTTTKRTPKAKS